MQASTSARSAWETALSHARSTFVPLEERSSSRGSLAAAVDRDRELVEDDVLGRIRQLGLKRVRERSGARGCGEEPRHDLLRRPQQHELLLERLREAAVAEVPAVELLEEADGALLAELAHRLVDEDDQLGGDLLAGRRERLALDHLPQG